MSRLWLLATFTVHLTSTTVHAQWSDSIYSGRRCDKHLTELRMPLLGELGDSVRFADLLSRTADPRARVTSAALHFGRDGNLQGVRISPHPSSSEGSQISDSIRAAVNPIGAHPRDFEVTLVRLNPTGQVRLLAETFTCPPQAHLTPEATAVLTTIRRDHSETGFYGRAMVEFVLEADGQVHDAWVSRGTTFTVVDSLLMQLLRAMRFDPAIVGRTPVAALVSQPFTF